MNLRKVGEAFQIVALAKPEYDSRINTQFDVKGSGTTAADDSHRRAAAPRPIRSCSAPPCRSVDVRRPSLRLASPKPAAAKAGHLRA